VSVQNVPPAGLLLPEGMVGASDGMVGASEGRVGTLEGIVGTLVEPAIYFGISTNGQIAILN
jgi:hypothetical protein